MTFISFPRSIPTRPGKNSAPTLFDNVLSERVDSVWSGHLHFPASTQKGRTTFHILPKSIHAHGKTYPDQGTLHVLDTKTGEVQRRAYG